MEHAMNAKLFLLRGAPGSGKSTRAMRMVDACEVDVHYEADQYFIQYGGKYVFRKEKLKEAHEQCQRRTRRALEAGLRVVVANTFTKVWELQPYFDMARELGCALTVSELLGQWDNVHGVPQSKVEQMRREFEVWP